MDWATPYGINVLYKYNTASMRFSIKKCSQGDIALLLPPPDIDIKIKIKYSKFFLAIYNQLYNLGF